MHCKIVATLGPASSNYETMKSMVQYGVRIFRLNFSHSNAATFVPVIKLIRKLENDLNQPLTILGDLCGPKIRIGEVEGSPLTINKGATLSLGTPDMREKAGDFTFVSLDVPELLQGLAVGMPVSLSDGMLQFNVTRVVKEHQLFEMRANNAGLLTSNKGIAFPGKFHPMPALTAKDRVDLHEGLDVGLDAVAISFVQDHHDVLDLREEIKKHGTWVPIVAKLERKNAVDNLEAILAATDVIMVARGDLALECPLEELPVIQKRLIRAARHAQKGVIVATQMLLSMVKNPMPTRAETTDVANAILDGADCVMLSEETAIGSYPTEAVKFINGLAHHAENYFFERVQGPYQPKKEKNPGKYLAYGACLLADQMDSPGIVSHSRSGATARLISSRRPTQPIYALTPDERVLRHLNFFFGIEPCSVNTEIKSHLERAEHFIQNDPRFKTGDTVVITAGQPTPGQVRDCQDDLCLAMQNMNTNQIKIYCK
jgi:pyruvate kinase